MESIVIADVKERIEKVVSGYRNGVGKSAYTLRVKDKYRMNSKYMVAYICFLLFSIPLYKLMFLPSVISGVASLTGIISLLIPYGFNYFKEKVWNDDYITEFDLFYLCENEHLYSIIIDEIKSGNRVTYTWLEESTNKICSFIQRQIEADNLKVIAEKIVNHKAESI
ncbi:hypothetical protein D3H66_19545 [Citrobacter portucalensis]|uniref:Uncharacterized protein n=1 Tax=Citrobacter portucalensis TaxID=1639133 RepID=A0A5B0SXH0_9ENTR|nr:hypothetical protein [Citrobacter portucalensis]KAA1141969.1 hypothetical protein D3H66_19545 [Citrobacter portucalensis]